MHDTNCKLARWWWEATQTYAKKGDNEFTVGNSEGTVRKHLDVLTGAEVELIPPCFHRAAGGFSVGLATMGLRNLRAIPRILNSGTVGPGERDGSLTHHTRSQSTDGNTWSADTQKRAHTNTYQPTSNHKDKCARPHRPRPLMHSHHSLARNTRAHASSRTLTAVAHTLLRAHLPLRTCTHFLARAHILHTSPRARSHRMHTPSCVRTYPGSRAHPRAHTRSVHSPSCARTRLHGREARGGAGAAQGAWLGAARRGRGAGWLLSCVPNPGP